MQLTANFHKSAQNWPGDLLLDGLSVGLAEQVEQEAGEVVGVRVGVSQLIGDTVEEEIPSLGIHIHRQILKKVNAWFIFFPFLL